MASAATEAIAAPSIPSPDEETEFLDAPEGAATAADIDNDDDDDDDDDVVTTRNRRAPREQPPGDVEDDGEEGLFGEGDDDDGLDGGDPQRGLDDAQLDSGDDLDRDDRMDTANSADKEELEDDDAPVEVINTMPLELGVHPTPEPSDGELYLFKVPRFLAFEPVGFDAATFQPPTTELHTKAAPSADFSAHQTAMRSIRWRKARDGSGQLQSNSRVLRWSDGSLTLQMGNDPGTQYLLPGNALTPPQHNPPKPTPTSTGAQKRKGMQRAQPYTLDADAFTYLAAPSESSTLLRVTNKLTTALRVEMSMGASEDAVRRLRERIEQSQKKDWTTRDAGQLDIVRISESPELAKIRAELAEKERLKAVRKREAQEMKNAERAAGRPAARRGPGMVLSASRLEDGDGPGAGARRRPGGATKPRQRRAAGRGEILSDDEDEAWGNRGRTREDEYDEEDDFLAPSDEEEEGEGAGDEDDEDIDEGIVLETTRSRKRPSPAAEQDAEGEPDEDDQGGRQNVKRRRVIDDDDDDE